MDWKALLGRITPRARLFIGIASASFIVDQLTKYLAVAALTRAFESASGGELGWLDRVWRFLSYRHPPRGAIVEVVADFWHMRYVENPGAAWGFLSGSASWFRTPFFLLVSLGAMAFIITYFRKSTPEQGLLRVALALVFGGAIGNFFDRVRLRYVIDFIDWHWYDRYTWPTFNVADAAISIGVGLLLLDMVLAGRKEQAAKVAAERAEPRR